jgi:hypothetical protein
MSDGGGDVRRHSEGDEGRCRRADHASGEKDLGHLRAKIAEQRLSAFLTKMTPKAEQSPQASRRNELYRLKVDHDLGAFLRADGRQQLQAQILRHSFGDNFRVGQSQDDNALLHPTLQVLEFRLSHGCESAKGQQPAASLFRQRGKGNIRELFGRDDQSAYVVRIKDQAVSAISSWPRAVR